jgi:hypothetical protein
MCVKKSFVIILCITFLLLAQEKQTPTISGWGWLTMGQVKSSELIQSSGTLVDFAEQPIGDLQAGIKFTQPIRSNTVCKLHLMTSFMVPVTKLSVGSAIYSAEQLQKSFSISLLEASLQNNTKLFENDTLTTEFGYFPVKYNPEAMNLGEYLFRSNAYPPLLISGFEIADKVKMAGVHTGYRKHGSAGTFKADMFVNTETENYPTLDISLSYLIGYTTPKPFFDFSSGISFFHMIPFDRNRTTPPDSRTYQALTMFVDSVTHDTTRYTFKGTKVAARATIDLKYLFNSEIFGKNDLKLYGESAILGLKDYPGWYNNIFERMPIMIGFNIPAFKLLDVLAAEVEYYPMPYQNSYHLLWKSSSPVPDFNLYAGKNYYSDWKPKTDDDWKWSVYASKKIKNIRLSGQIASDHSSRAPYLIYKTYTEMVPRTKDWYYLLRCSFFF